MTAPTTHFLDQVVKFGKMLDGKIPADRSRDVMKCQLTWNLCNYTRDIKGDGREGWRMLERCILDGEYDAVVKYAQDALDAQAPTSAL